MSKIIQKTFLKIATVQPATMFDKIIKISRFSKDLVADGNKILNISLL